MAWAVPSRPSGKTDPVAFTALSVVAVALKKPSESVGAGARPVKGRNPGRPIRSGRPSPPLRSPESQHRSDEPPGAAHRPGPTTPPPHPLRASAERADADKGK